MGQDGQFLCALKCRNIGQSDFDARLGLLIISVGPQCGVRRFQVSYISLTWEKQPKNVMFSRLNCFEPVTQNVFVKLWQSRFVIEPLNKCRQDSLHRLCLTNCLRLLFQWNAVALWAWDIVVDNCAICRNHIMDLCEFGALWPLFFSTLLPHLNTVSTPPPWVRTVPNR